MSTLSSFDLDFRYGYAGEQLVEELLTNGKTVEVKRDRRWHETGNLYIEVECWYNSTQSWQASGIAITEADYWAIAANEVYKACRKNGMDESTALAFAMDRSS